MIVQAEDFALLGGSILVFTVLGIVMVATRNIDWYKVGEQLGVEEFGRKR